MQISLIEKMSKLMRALSEDVDNKIHTKYTKVNNSRYCIEIFAHVNTKVRANPTVTTWTDVQLNMFE